MTTKQSTTIDRIIRDPSVLVGKPIIRGTRVPVELVLAKLARNPDVQELLADYPRLIIDDVRACLEYATDLVEREYAHSKANQSA